MMDEAERQIWEQLIMKSFSSSLIDRGRRKMIDVLPQQVDYFLGFRHPILIAIFLIFAGNKTLNHLARMITREKEAKHQGEVRSLHERDVYQSPLD